MHNTKIDLAEDKRSELIDILNQRPRARRCRHEIAHQRKIRWVMHARIVRRVHELYREIDALGRRVRLARSHDVLLAKDRNAPIHQKPRALIGIGDDAIPDQDTLTGFEFDPQRHWALSAPQG